MTAFALNQRVNWTSQAGGHAVEKLGVITAIVEPGELPPGVRCDGLPRKELSYVVRVDGRGLYWPRVSQLRAAG